MYAKEWGLFSRKARVSFLKAAQNWLESGSKLAQNWSKSVPMGSKAAPPFFPGRMLALSEILSFG
jgi:hypothetical protein